MGMRPGRTDLLLPAAVATMVVIELGTVRPPGALAAGCILVAASALLVWRRRWPIPVGVGAGVLALTPPWLGPQLDDIVGPVPVLMLACFTLARWVPGLRGLVFLVLPALVLLSDFVFVDDRDKTVGDYFWIAILLLPPYVFGRVTRKLAVQAEQLQDREELVKQAAVRDERDRIAREVHDVIAHSVSAMVVQVAAARDLVRGQPERAEQVLDRVAETGRRAIAETGRLLHVIRDSDDELGLTPTPGLRDLPALVAELEEAGLAVDLLVDDVPEELPAAVDVSAYRILRETLTNALRYSSTRSVRVEVLGTGDGLTIRATNPSDGRSGLGSGLGLTGLGERIELLGGTLRHGPRGTDYELVASVPLEQREPV